MHYLYIDVETGVYGMADNLRVVESTPAMVDLLDDGSDADIIDAGIEYGSEITELLEEL